MSLYEYILGGVLIVVSLVIIFFTLMQNQKGQGLSAAIMGENNNAMAAGRGRTNEAKLATGTKVCGALLFVITLVVCILSARL